LSWARRLKTIVDVVRDATFAARKDEQLLMGREPLPWPLLEEYRRRFRGERDPELRREISLELQHALHGHEGPLGISASSASSCASSGRHGQFVQLERFASTYFRHFAGPAAGQPFRFEAFSGRS
jgi:hypothetical protein